MEFNEKDNPHLIKTGEGFNVLNTVFYKEKFLYSKYNPQKTILKTIQDLKILPNTIILICSPALWYGINELLEKLPENCKVIAAEFDSKLYELAENEFSKLEISKEKKLQVKFYNFFQLMQLDDYLRKIIKTGDFKRILKINFSGGVQFENQKYEELTNGMQEIISVFWKNRITLQKMGKLFTKNTIRNLYQLKNNLQLSDVQNTIEKNILICGAGESLDYFSDWNKVKDNFFVISVDAAAKALCAKNIIPDAIVALESQFAIQKSYIGLKNYFKQKEPIFFSDLSSRSEISNLFTKKVFFLSKFSDCNFIAQLKNLNIAKDFVEPLGSVGLLAVYLALKLRKSANTKIFVLGLDFAFTKGKTHAKNTQATIQRFLENSKFSALENFTACFSNYAFSFKDKKNNLAFSNKALSSYANQFKTFFSNEKNLFDCGDFGIDLGLKHNFEISENKFKNQNGTKSFDNKFTDKEFYAKFENPLISENLKTKVDEFYSSEIKSLEEALSLLKNGENSEFRNKKISLDEQISELLAPRDYLYLHFPDGQKFHADESFLKRVRAEIVFFIKQFSLAVNLEQKNQQNSVIPNSVQNL